MAVDDEFEQIAEWLKTEKGLSNLEIEKSSFTFAITKRTQN